MCSNSVDSTEYNFQHSRVLRRLYAFPCIELRTPVVAYSRSVRKRPNPEQVPHATQPRDERGTHIIPSVSPNDSARWLALADTALKHGASEDDVAEMEALARKEQKSMKRSIRRTVQRVNRQSKTKQ